MRKLKNLSLTICEFVRPEREREIERESVKGERERAIVGKALDGSAVFGFA